MFLGRAMRRGFEDETALRVQSDTGLARLCPGCGVVLPAGERGRCARCVRPQRSGSSRPELDRSAWQKLRRAARLRDGNRCVNCGSSERLSVHNAVEGSNLLEHLVTLCSRCHAREHNREAPVKEAIFLDAKGATPTRQVAASFVQRRGIVAWPAKGCKNASQIAVLSLDLRPVAPALLGRTVRNGRSGRCGSSAAHPHPHLRPGAGPFAKGLPK
jgi:5-methylcytosine-specific restriction enzyme A